MLSDNSVPQSRLQHLWMLLLLPHDTQVILLGLCTDNDEESVSVPKMLQSL